MNTYYKGVKSPLPPNSLGPIKPMTFLYRAEKQAVNPQSPQPTVSGFLFANEKKNAKLLIPQVNFFQYFPTVSELEVCTALASVFTYSLLRAQLATFSTACSTLARDPDLTCKYFEVGLAVIKGGKLLRCFQLLWLLGGFWPFLLLFWQFCSLFTDDPLPLLISLFLL